MKSLVIVALVALAWNALAWAGGTVKIAGPPGTVVYLDGIYAGAVPLVLEDLTPGTHEVRLVGPGGEQRSRSVQVPSALDSYQEVDGYSMRVDLDALLTPPYWNAPYFTPQPFRYDPWYTRPLGYPRFRTHPRIRTPVVVPPVRPHRPHHPGGPGHHRGRR